MVEKSGGFSKISASLGSAMPALAITASMPPCGESFVASLKKEAWLFQSVTSSLRK